jgi:hypothetical protein
MTNTNGRGLRTRHWRWAKFSTSVVETCWALRAVDADMGGNSVEVRPEQGVGDQCEF